MIVTKSFDDAKYKIVPRTPTPEIFEDYGMAYVEILASFPDDLPGVVTHSGEPCAFMWTSIIDYENLSIDRPLPERVLGGDMGEVLELFTHPASDVLSAEITELRCHISKLQSIISAHEQLSTIKTAREERQSMLDGSNNLDYTEDQLKSMMQSQGLTQIYDMFGIGVQARTISTLKENIKNAIRREKCLSAIEREFFTASEPDEDEPEFNNEVWLLNWGDDPDEYVKKFGITLQADHGPLAIIAATIEKCAVIAESKCVCDSEGEQDAVDFVARNKSQRIRAIDPSTILAGIK